MNVMAYLICKVVGKPSQVELIVKNLSANAGDLRDVHWIPESGRSHEGRNGNPLQNSCLENPMDRGAQQATALGVTMSQTQLKQLGTQANIMLACSKWHVIA